MTDTPPWQVEAWDLRADLAKVAQQWTPVHEVLADSGLYELRAPSVSRWSCGEQAGHILLVAQQIARQIEGNLAEPDRDKDGVQADFAARTFEAGSFPRGRGQAPEPLRPEGHSRADFETLLTSVVEAWERVAAREPDLAACAARAKHFAFGYLTCAEWVRFCAIHTAHHLAIVRDMRDMRPV